MQAGSSVAIFGLGALGLAVSTLRKLPVIVNRTQVVKCFFFCLTIREGRGSGDLL